MSIAQMSGETTVEIRSHRKAQWFWLDNALIDTYAPAIGPIGVALYAALARYWNHKTGTCNPSLGLLGRKLGITPLTVSRYLQKLEEQSLIAIEPRPGHTAAITLLDMPESETATGQRPADEGALPSKEVPHEEGKDLYPTSEGIYLVNTTPLPGKDEPDSPHQKERTTPKPPDISVGRKEAQPPTALLRDPARCAPTEVPEELRLAQCAVNSTGLAQLWATLWPAEVATLSHCQEGSSWMNASARGARVSPDR